MDDLAEKMAYDARLDEQAVEYEERTGKSFATARSRALKKQWASEMTRLTEKECGYAQGITQGIV